MIILFEKKGITFVLRNILKQILCYGWMTYSMFRIKISISSI